MSDRWNEITAEYLPDYVLHPLNGEWVVSTGTAFATAGYWLSAEDAAALGQKLIAEAERARRFGARDRSRRADKAGTR